MNQKGFTLIELMAAIILLAVLATMSIPAYGTIRDQMAKRERDFLVSEIESAALSYATDNNVTNGTYVLVADLIVDGYMSGEGFSYEKQYCTRFVKKDEDSRVTETISYFPILHDPLDSSINLATTLVLITIQDYQYFTTVTDISATCTTIM